MKRWIVVVLTHQPSKETFAMKVVVNHSHLSREVFDNIFLVLAFVTLFKFLWSRAYYDFLSDKFQPSVYISGSVACLHARCQLAQQSWWPRYQTRDLNKCLAFGSEKQPTLPHVWIENLIPNSTRDCCKVQTLWEDNIILNISHFVLKLLTYLVTSKQSMISFQIFVAFSEYLNFMKSKNLDTKYVT